MNEDPVSNSIMALEDVAETNFGLAVTAAAATKILLESGMSFQEVCQIMVKARHTC